MKRPSPAAQAAAPAPTVPAVPWPARAAACAGALGWTWAVLLLACRRYQTCIYGVTVGYPPLWGFLGLPFTVLLPVAIAGVCIGLACAGTARRAGAAWPALWLAPAWIVPVLDLLRLTGVPIPNLFIEPLLVAWSSGMLAAAWARHLPSDAPRAVVSPRVFPAVITAASLASFAWWTHEGLRYYAAYLLGFNDFGHFAYRVASTWVGRGFLQETPILPAFWDHFNPGLALLAPLWGLWPDVRLFIFLQAACLASAGPLAYALARALGARPAAAAAWGGATLVYPSLGQINLSFGYGWHPISLALPLLLAMLIALARGRKWLAAALALAAASFQEDVFVVLACLAAAFACHSWLLARRSQPDDTAHLAGRLSAGVWLVVAAMMVAAFLAVWWFAPFSRYQTVRFAALGDTPWQILASPIMRPKVFWSTVLRPASAYFVLARAVPLGLRSLAHAGPLLLALLPLGVLIAWPHAAASALAFHYPTTLIPVLLLVALSGALLTRRGNARHDRLLAAGLEALVAGAVASLSIGAMPWSTPTLDDMLGRTYGIPVSGDALQLRAPGTAGHALLEEVAAVINARGDSALASGRAASHLLGASRLDTLNQALERWSAYQQLAGAARSPIELFDWVVIDTSEGFFQGVTQCEFILNHAFAAGYERYRVDEGIIVLTRPGLRAR